MECVRNSGLTPGGFSAEFEPIQEEGGPECGIAPSAGLPVTLNEGHLEFRIAG